MEQLLNALRARYVPDALAPLQITVGVHVPPEGWAVLHFDNEQVHITAVSKPPEAEVAFSILFADEPTALACFADIRQAMQAFQQGKLRSTGYIMRTFAVLRAFPAGT